MILVIGERVNNLKLTDAQVEDWHRIWTRYSWSAAMKVPGMVHGSARKRLDSVLPEDKWIVNLLPPDNKCGTWDINLAKQTAKQAVQWLMSEKVDGVILLGYRVRKAFEFVISGNNDLKRCHIIMGKPVLAIPHPSLRNRLWDQKTIAAQVRKWIVTHDKK